ncbi:DUF3422 family protein [Rhodocyclus tenuis]|uniref:DUF3422 family protein n=2 Tax=Rhodocyclus TaxID=1064 RepID=A0A6L5JW92_RHOTE|nr:DUF3422 domain-containing protein [Rhodocyclus gracilis]MQY51509.1 DUF3422 family protein [Rhodocyclus gracilis]MRD72251.1 DUF3422 family protein [Rhodocyclus gracilis]NJA89357.1 DUF3422 family protein [Rhodocyclus gracilis]
MLASFEFEEHPLRQRLNQEFHARPPIPLAVPTLVSHLAFKHEGNSVADEREHLSRLCNDGVCRFLENSDTHLVLEAEKFTLRWELHTEFSSYTFSHPLAPGEAGDGSGTAATALQSLLPEWLAAIPGKLIVATHVELRSAREITPEAAMAAYSASSRQVAASLVSGGSAWVFSDFMFDEGFTRFLVIDISLTERQAGRTVQRLVEIETYRIMALLGLPVAKQVGRWLPDAEKRLAAMMSGIVDTQNSDDEREVLAELSRLAAEVEDSVARTTYRFGASHAYHSFVNQRIEELREVRVPGFPIFSEFMQRRLLPAMNTCDAMARRQEDLSGRVVRSSQLLRTRVDIELERQNQALLAQMNNRARLQLRLQETVEGLSVVAITYYGSQLVKNLSAGVAAIIPELSPEVAAALSVPLIATFSLIGIRKMRQQLAREEGEES